MKLYRMEMGKQVVCEVTTEYPAFCGVAPRLNKDWLRTVLVCAIRSYFQNQQKYGVVKA